MMISSAKKYIEHLKKQDKKYQWPLESYEQRKLEATERSVEFPHTITFEGAYCEFDDLEDECRKLLGDMHGKCNWEECEWSFLRWYRESGYEKELEDLIYRDINRSERPEEGTPERELWDDYVHMCNHEHWDMIKNEYLGQPGEHSHRGVWTTVWLMKTGYDYGFQEFKFRHIDDYMLFCLTCL